MRKKSKGDTWDGIFADPEVGRVLKVRGLIADANKSSIKELATITSLNPGGTTTTSYFYNNKVITQFPELKYCTGLTTLVATFNGCSNLTTVGDIIPESVTNLTRAFESCSSLTTAPVLPSRITGLSRAFYGCSSLLEAPVIPEGVMSLYETFRGCSSLTKAPAIPSSATNLYYTFYDCTSIDGIYIINIKTPPTYDSSLSNVQAIYVPDESVSTYKSAYRWSSYSNKIYPMSDMSDMEGDIVFADPEVGRVLKVRGLIADPVKSSKRELATITSLNPDNKYNTSYFNENTKIKQFPELKYFTGLTSSGLYGAFRGCSSLTTVGDIPEGVTNLGNAFSRCSSLTTAPIIPSSVTNLNDTFFNCSSIDGIYIINIVTPVSYSYSLSNVQAIYVPDASVSTYKSRTGWSDFADKIYPMSSKP